MSFSSSGPPALRSSLHPRYEIKPYGSNAFATFFVAVQAAGAGCMLLVLLTIIFSSQVRRNAASINFCVAWVIYALSYLILAFAGQETGPPPSHDVCFVQAVLVYGSPPLAAAVVLSLILQLWFDVSASISRRSIATRPIRTTCLVIGPYIVWLAVLGEALYFALKSPQDVVRLGSSAYCVIDTGIPGSISTVLAAIILAVGVVIQIMIALALRKSTLALARQRTRGAASLASVNTGTTSEASTIVAPSPGTGTGTSSSTTAATIRITLRIAVFTVVTIFAIGVAGAFMAKNVETEIPNGVMAMMPLIVFFIFGTQRDILRAWTFWRPAAKPVSAMRPKLAISKPISKPDDEWSIVYP